MKAYELIAPIEAIAPKENQEGWDNCGFSVGSPAAEVTKALFALDCTESIIDEAIGEGCDIIITHHPLIFRGLKSINPDTHLGRIINKAIKHNIVVYSAHTNIDKATPGVSTLMADRLGLIERKTLSAAGFGIVGNLPESLSAEQLIELVKNRFGQKIVRCSAPQAGSIKRVALCGGSGGDFISEAMCEGAQAYITGDLTYHEFYCEEGFMIIDIGHYGGEYEVLSLFAKIVSENFPNFAALIGKENTNPIYYY
jgi:dinuclear metal center YbgI/SA1388 family protein